MKHTSPKIQLVNLVHKGQSHIGLRFRYNEDLLNIIRDIPLARWSKTHRIWYLPYSDKNIELIHNCFKKDAIIDSKGLSKQAVVLDKKKQKRQRQLSEEQKLLLNNFYKYLRGKRYSKSTIDTYTFFVADFIEFHNNKAVDQLTNRDVELFIETVFIQRNYSISTQRQFISALKLFIVFEPATHINSLELLRPNKDKKLPNVLSQEEVLDLIRHTKNLKHKTITTLLYSCGLRISELLNLKLSDIDTDRKQLYVKNSKGRKDRVVSLANTILPVLKTYYMNYKPKQYLFEGSNGKKYSHESVRQFIRRNSKKAQIKKVVTPHTLRHSYATHLLENGVDIRYIQSLLGHSKPETTMIYTHVRRKDLMDIMNPLDVALEKLNHRDKTNPNVLISRQITR
ncbi:tyrosine-type recombinase/integrase [Winogradskyella sp. ZXX205]|uniref:Tyrosine-type recombinase/integrase n=1 Tax=Winogradskyella ouciana TaxID=2608631 RepID=A0A7K1GBB9_9FLAO|nr:site-specific tyrosine recombinase/integron integrase [Winogradskyella ouciana]MTE26421.1 tyrosine-type recombinase/integrase [Winogradskyella ouciana]